METKVYVKVSVERGEKLVPYEDFTWTGRWKIKTIRTRESYPPGYGGPRNKFKITSTLSLERQMWIFPWWKVWVCENEFEFREEACYIGDCDCIDQMRTI